MFKKIQQLIKSNRHQVFYAFIFPIMIGILTALILSNQFTSTTVISPKRSSPEASSNGVGFLAALSGIEDEKLSPELRFATNYFYSYKVIVFSFYFHPNFYTYYIFLYFYSFF